MIGVGAIGAGRFASGVLLPILRRMPGVQLLEVAADHGSSAQAAARRFQIPSSTTDYRSVFKNPSVQAVVIATPHHLHAEMVLAGLRCGRHLFVEKPLCLTRQELEEIAAAYRSLETPPVLSVGFNRRFSWAARAAKDRFRDRRGPLTILYRVNASHPLTEGWWKDPLISGGSVLGEIGHFIDLMSFFADAVPVKVSTSAPRSEPGQAEQGSLVSSFSFADGSLGTLVYSTSADPACPKERIELLGEGKAVLIEDFRSIRSYLHGRLNVQRRLVQEKGFRAEMAAFIQAVRSGGPGPAPFSELYATTLATFKAVESLQRGQPVSIEAAPDAQR